MAEIKNSLFEDASGRSKVSLTSTDEHSGYRLLGQDFRHGVVRHSKGECVAGAVHTNTIESFWSLIKRGIMAIYHKVSRKYLPLYVAEFQFATTIGSTRTSSELP